MSGLGQEFEDVLSESSTDAADLPEHEEEVELEEEIEAESAEAESDDDPDGETKTEKKGRTLDNVYRELARKTDRQDATIQAMQASVEALRNDLRSNKPAKVTGESLEDYSVTELRAMLPKVSDDKKEEFKEYLTERLIRDTLKTEVKGEFDKQRETQVRRDVAREAQRRFPQLRDKNSEFYRRVESKLNERGTKYKTENQYAVLDVARAVADDMGIPAPRSRRVPSNQGGTDNLGTRSAPKKAGDLSGLEPSEEEVKAILKRYKHTMRGKPMDDKAIKRLQKRVAEYRANQHHLKERIRVSFAKD